MHHIECTLWSHTVHSTQCMSVSEEGHDSLPALTTSSLHVCCHWSKAICLDNYIPHTFHAVIIMSCPSLENHRNTGKLKWRQDKFSAMRGAPARQGGLKYSTLNIGTIVIACSQDHFWSFCTPHHYSHTLHCSEDPSFIYYIPLVDTGSSWLTM